jgi:Uma2 family endonuclease
MVAPAGDEHGRIGTMGIAIALGSFVKQRGLGIVYALETGFQIGHHPDTVRVPDVAFVRAERIPPGRSKGFIQGAPDLAVEIISPTDRASEVKAKAQDWLEAGCRVVWVVDPETKTVTVYRGGAETVLFRESDTLSGGDVLPGFSLPVSEIFA